MVKTGIASSIVKAAVVTVTTAIAIQSIGHSVFSNCPGATCFWAFANLKLFLIVLISNCPNSQLSLEVAAGPRGASAAGAADVASAAVSAVCILSCACRGARGAPYN